MRIVFFSDIHGNKYAFNMFLKQVENEKADKIIFCGDVFGYYYYADYIIQKMMRLNFICLLGNHDKMLLDILDGKLDPRGPALKYGSVYMTLKDDLSESSIDFLRELSPQYSFKTDGLSIGVFHGTPDDPLNGRLYPDTNMEKTDSYSKYDFVILGHTHHKMLRQINHTFVINPGSLGQQRDGKGCSYLIFDTITKSFDFHTVNYNISNLVYDIERFDHGNNKLTEVLYRECN